jgi:hypothetical protein
LIAAIVAHALLRVVFALLRTHVWKVPWRSHECERGTQKCVRYLTAMVTEFCDWTLPTAIVTGTDGPLAMFDGI